MPVELCDGLAAREAAQVPDAERAVVSAAYHEVVDEAGEEGGGRLEVVRVRVVEAVGGVVGVWGGGGGRWVGGGGVVWGVVWGPGCGEGGVQVVG